MAAIGLSHTDVPKVSARHHMKPRIAAMSDGQPILDSALGAWEMALPRVPTPLRRFKHALLRLIRHRPAPGGYWRNRDDDTPPEGAGLPARPKQPSPRRQTSAEVDLPRDGEGACGGEPLSAIDAF